MMICAGNRNDVNGIGSMNTLSSNEMYSMEMNVVPVEQQFFFNVDEFSTISN